MNKYQKWIEENVIEAYGKCTEVTLKMVEEFPELTRVRGHFDCPNRGRSEHWWLTLGSDIIDPTISQFIKFSDKQYEPWDESAPEPTGKCGNCGAYCYDGSYVCSDRCEKILREYMENI